MIKKVRDVVESSARLLDGSYLLPHCSHIFSKIPISEIDFPDADKFLVGFFWCLDPGEHTSFCCDAVWQDVKGATSGRHSRDKAKTTSRQYRVNRQEMAKESEVVSFCSGWAEWAEVSFFIIHDITSLSFWSNLTHCAQEHSTEAHCCWQNKETVSSPLLSSSDAQIKCEKQFLDWDRVAGCAHADTYPAAYTFWNYIYASQLLGLVVLWSECYLGQFTETETIPYWLYLHHVAHSMEIFQSDSRIGWAHKLYEIWADPLPKIVTFLINPHTVFLTEKY